MYIPQLRRHQPNRAIASGSFTRGNKRRPTVESCRLCVNFPKDLFDQVRAYAVREDVSMSEAVRTFVTWGLESVDIAERDADGDY